VKNNSIPAVLALAVLVLAAGAPAVSGRQIPAKAVDLPKIMAEIAGAYDFDAQGQLLAITFYVQDGKLFGMPEGEHAEQLLPVKGDNPLKFDVTVADNGQYYELEFGRDEKGQIDKCTLKTQGQEIIGKKRAKTS
jgi:hypothetical protein